MTAVEFTAEDVERKVANVVAGHRLAGFEPTEDDREAARAIIAGELTGDESVARLLSGFRREDLTAKHVG